MSLGSFGERVVGELGVVVFTVGGGDAGMESFFIVSLVMYYFLEVFCWPFFSSLCMLCVCVLVSLQLV